MKKIIAALVCLVLALIVFTPVEKIPYRKITQTPLLVPDKPKAFAKESVDQTRLPSSLSTPPVNKRPALDLGSPKENLTQDRPEYQHSALAGLPKGFELVSDVYAIKDHDQFQFIESKGRVPGSANVAMNLSTGRLAPISSVIKITNVSEDERKKLLAQGFVEHVYQPELQILFVEAQHETVLDTHSALLKDGYTSELEVLRHYNRPR